VGILCAETSEDLCLEPNMVILFSPLNFCLDGGRGEVLVLV
jgi:hypothetical protein